MSLQIFIQGIRDRAKGTLIAAILILGFVFYIGSVYPEVANIKADALANMMNNPAIQALVGNSVTDLSSFEGFMSIELYSYMVLIIGAYMAFITASFIAGEIENRTGDLLLSLPVSREGIVLSRFAVIIPVSVLISGAIAAGAILSARFINVEINEWAFINASLFLIAFSLAVGAMSLFISTFLSDSKQSALISIGVLVLMFFMKNLAAMVTVLDSVKPLSLFTYTNISDIIMGNEVSVSDLGILLGITIVFLALAVLNFRRRDINFA